MMPMSTLLTDLSAVSSAAAADLLYTVAAGADRKVRACALRAGIGINVLSLSSDPSSVTDWGTILNAAVAAGVKHFWFPAGIYPFTTPLNLNDSRMVTFQGEGGGVWFGDNRALDMCPSSLIYKGSGAAAAISARTSSGLTVRDMGVYYDNSAGSFTGSLIDLAGTSATSLFERCYLGSKYASETVCPQTALCIIDWDNAIVSTLRDCTVGGAQWSIFGVRTAFSNANRILNCVLHSGSLGLIGNIGQQWTIESCTFEVGNNSGPVIDSAAHADYTSIFTLLNCWGGDGEVRFRQRTWNSWATSFIGNYVTSPTGPLFVLEGGGDLKIVNNQAISANTNGPVIDLGDTTAGAVAFNSVTISGNSWVCTDPDGVLNREGHRNLHIYGNGRGSGTPELRTFSGHERLGYPDRWVTPTVAAGPALGTGGTATLADGSTDVAGQIVLGPGSGSTAGVVAKVTFGSPMLSERSAGVAPLIQITPTVYSTGALALPYIDSGLFDNTGFWLSTANGLTGSASYYYRVLQR